MPSSALFTKKPRFWAKHLLPKGLQSDQLVGVTSRVHHRLLFTEDDYSIKLDKVANRAIEIDKRFKLYQEKCNLCGAKTAKLAKFFCRACQVSAREISCTVRCKTCNKNFERPFADYTFRLSRNMKESFCSQKCMGPSISLRTKKYEETEGVCIYCGKPRPRLRTRCCSHECWSKWRRIKRDTPRPCVWCQKPFTGKPLEIKSCSEACRRNQQRATNELFCLKKFGPIEDRISLQKRSSLEKAVRNLIVERDKVCAICNSDLIKSKTDMHHIDRNPLNNVAANLILLCMDCHRLGHGAKTLNDKKLKAIARKRTREIRSNWHSRYGCVQFLYKNSTPSSRLSRYFRMLLGALIKDEESMPP